MTAVDAITKGEPPAERRTPSSRHISRPTRRSIRQWRNRNVTGAADADFRLATNPTDFNSNRSPPWPPSKTPRTR